jgi:hypothetical protein
MWSKSCPPPFCFYCCRPVHPAACTMPFRLWDLAIDASAWVRVVKGPTHSSISREQLRIDESASLIWRNTRITASACLRKGSSFFSCYDPKNRGQTVQCLEAMTDKVPKSDILPACCGLCPRGVGIETCPAADSHLKVGTRSSLVISSDSLIVYGKSRISCSCAHVSWS